MGHENSDSLAQQVLEAGYYVVNYRRHLVARLPHGKPARLALAEAHGNHSWALMLSDVEAGHQFLQTYAFEQGLLHELEADDFEEFVALGGCTYRESKQQELLLTEVA